MDDNDLIHLSQDDLCTVLHAHAALQSSVTSWSNLLVATGGALKPSKCFFYLKSYSLDSHGQWKYANNDKHDTLSIEVTLPDGLTAPIEHLSIDPPSTTLGGTTCSSGNTTKVTLALSEKAMKWANSARNSGLHPRDFHVSALKKFSNTTFAPAQIQTTS